jgi:AhpD family alkylhydroperoxidase
MLHDATAFYESWPATMNMAKAKGPDIGKAFGPFFQGLMKDGGEGGLSPKCKELIALGIGIAVRCEPCIYTHIEKCLKAGATPKEVMDTAGVAVMMGGGPVYVYTPLVAAALEHFEKAGLFIQPAAPV